MQNIIKVASPDADFEQGFFQLAYDKLQGKLFNLLPFLVGFEVVRKSEDGGKAIGVFGFKSENGQILYVPTFFVNGKVKDLDTLYSKNNNQFYPLDEDFAELFLKDDVTGIGSAAQSSTNEIKQDVMPKNYRDLIRPPTTGRISMASAAPEYDPQALKKAGLSLESAYSHFLTSHHKVAHVSLMDFVTAAPNQTKQDFWDLMVKSADFTEAVRNFYSDTEIATAMKPHPVVKEAKDLEVLRFEDKTAYDLTDEQKEQLTKRGYAILDTRRNKSNFGIIKFTEKFGNPTSSGFYPYVTETGSIRYGIVLLRPAQLRQGFATEDAIVIDLEAKKKGQAYLVNAKNIFVKDSIKVTDFSELHKMLEEPAEALPSFSDTYVLVNEALQCTQPFRILENFKDQSAIRRLKVEPDVEGGCGCTPVHKDAHKAVTLVFTKKPGHSLDYKNNMTYVPKGFKLLKINTSTYYNDYVPYDLPADERKKREAEVKEEKSRIREGKPGPLSSLTSMLSEKGVFPLTVHTTSNEFFATIPGAKAKYPNALEAKIGMVVDFGMEEKQAAELIESVVEGIPVHGYIKLAVTGDRTLSLIDEAPYSNEFGQPTYHGVPHYQEMPRDDSYIGDPTRAGLGVQPDVEGIEGEVNKATQMAQAGQKEIFDTQSIATLARYSDPTTKVLQYIPNFVDALDNLGRMLFLIYWETDKFEKMYGKDELPELIELLKNVFKNLGDLIIFLKRKLPEISINNNEQAMDQV